MGYNSINIFTFLKNDIFHVGSHYYWAPSGFLLNGSLSPHQDNNFCIYCFVQSVSVLNLFGPN